MRAGPLPRTHDRKEHCYGYLDTGAGASSSAG